MKRNLILFSLCLNFWSHYSQKLSEVKPVPIKGIYTNPIVSPTGEYALLTSSNFNGVYLLNLKSNKVFPISKVSGSGYSYSWSNDGTSFSSKKKTK